MTDLDSAIHALGDWLRIPSVSTAGGNREALVEAAGWAGSRRPAAAASSSRTGTTRRWWSASWPTRRSSSTPAGGRLLAEAGARPADARAGQELHERTMAGTSVDVHRVAAGEPRTIVPERAEASLSVLAAFAARGVPTIVGGFALPEDRIHAPDESYRIDSLDLGLEAARALYEELASLR